MNYRPWRHLAGSGIHFAGGLRWRWESPSPAGHRAGAGHLDLIHRRPWLTVERIAYRPLRGAPRLAPLISAIGVSIVLQNYVQLAQGARVKPLQPMISGTVPLSSGVTISVLQILIIALTLVLMAAFTTFIRTTPFGRAQRAPNRTGPWRRCWASMSGVISATFVLARPGRRGRDGDALLGVIDFYIGFAAGIKAFSAAVLGGIGSLPGAMLGGFMIGLLEAFWSGYFSIAYKDVAIFAILVLVLIFRPSGLLGRPGTEKV
jgi:branched-chain amino acid transport system permease protein